MYKLGSSDGKMNLTLSRGKFKSPVWLCVNQPCVNAVAEMPPARTISMSAHAQDVNPLTIFQLVSQMRR